MSIKDSEDSDGLPGPRLLLGRSVGDALVQLHMDRERQTEPDRIQYHHHHHRHHHHEQAAKRYQTLLPAVDSSSITRGLATDPNRKLPPKRKLVLVACSRCRQKKEKVALTYPPYALTRAVIGPNRFYSATASAPHAAAASRRRRNASTRWTTSRSAGRRP